MQASEQSSTPFFKITKSPEPIFQIPVSNHLPIYVTVCFSGSNSFAVSALSSFFAIYKDGQLIQNYPEQRQISDIVQIGEHYYVYEGPPYQIYRVSINGGDIEAINRLAVQGYNHRALFTIPDQPDWLGIHKMFKTIWFYNTRTDVLKQIDTLDTGDQSWLHDTVFLPNFHVFAMTRDSKISPFFNFKCDIETTTASLVQRPPIKIPNNDDFECLAVDSTNTILAVCQKDRNDGLFISHVLFYKIQEGNVEFLFDVDTLSDKVYGISFALNIKYSQNKDKVIFTFFEHKDNSKCLVVVGDILNSKLIMKAVIQTKLMHPIYLECSEEYPGSLRGITALGTQFQVHDIISNSEDRS